MHNNSHLLYMNKYQVNTYPELSDVCESEQCAFANLTTCNIKSGVEIHLMRQCNVAKGTAMSYEKEWTASYKNLEDIPGPTLYDYIL